MYCSETEHVKNDRYGIAVGALQLIWRTRVMARLICV
jgi:hypothetical protein